MWTIDENKYQIFDETGENILVLVDIEDHAKEEFVMNLTLAAPDLLDACKQAIPLLCQLGDFIGNGEITSETSLGHRCDVILMMKKAIAKAKGEK